MQLGTCIYINVWWYIYRISLCQLKSYKLVSHFIMRKTFALYYLPYTKQFLNGDTLSLSFSHSVSPFLKSLEIVDLSYLAFQRYDIMPSPHFCFGSCTYIILKLELVIYIVERPYFIWYSLWNNPMLRNNSWFFPQEKIDTSILISFKWINENKLIE